MTRREFREQEFKLLFHVEFYRECELDAQVERYLLEEEIPEEVCGDLKNFVTAFSAKKVEIDEQLTEVSQKWRLNRMNKVDLAILRLAAYEIRFQDDIPVRVSINEAVELAKLYGGDESPQFVNGVLGNFLKHFEISCE